MRQYHCIKLIESKQMFHLGIAHNIILQKDWVYILQHFHNLDYFYGVNKTSYYYLL
jgi:hypothetical protein